MLDGSEPPSASFVSRGKNCIVRHAQVEDLEKLVRRKECGPILYGPEQAVRREERRLVQLCPNDWRPASGNINAVLW